MRVKSPDDEYMDDLEVQVSNLKKALEELYFGYVRLMENGRDRIMMLGGDCDTLQRMEESDPLLIEMREILK